MGSTQVSEKTIQLHLAPFCCFSLKLEWSLQNVQFEQDLFVFKILKSPNKMKLKTKSTKVRLDQESFCGEIF